MFSFNIIEYEVPVGQTQVDMYSGKLGLEFEAQPRC